MSKVKLTLSPYGDNFMFIDKESDVFLSLTVPTCVIEQQVVTQAIKNSVLSGNIVLEEIIEEVPPEIVDPEGNTENTEQPVVEAETVVKEAKKAKAKSAKK